MPSLRPTALALLLAAVPVAAVAQADRTGIGGGPLSTDTARNTTAVGVTKPPSRDASPTSRDNPSRRSQNDTQQDRIVTGICIGCSAK